MRTLPIGVIAVAALVVPAQLFADENDDLFARIDANQDGFVTANEVNPEHKTHFERMLRDCDANKDCKLTKKEFLAPLAASKTAAEERVRIDGVVRWAAVAGSEMPIALFNRMATASAIPHFQQGDGNPYGKLMKFPDDSQRMLVIRNRADGTRDVLLVTAPPNGGSNYYYLINGSGNLIAGYFAQPSATRRLNATESARLKDELAYWKKWEVDTKRARLVPKDAPAKPGK